MGKRKNAPSVTSGPSSTPFCAVILEMRKTAQNTASRYGYGERAMGCGWETGFDMRNIIAYPAADQATVAQFTFGETPEKVDQHY